MHRLVFLRARVPETISCGANSALQFIPPSDSTNAFVSSLEIEFAALKPPWGLPYTSLSIGALTLFQKFGPQHS